MRLSRKLRAGVAVFCGPHWWCPLIPYFPKVTMVIGDPTSVEKTEAPSEGGVDKLHTLYQESMTKLETQVWKLQSRKLFDENKASAGFGDRALKVL